MLIGDFVQLVLGMALGGLVAWLVLRERSKRAVEKAKSEREAEWAAAHERLRACDEEFLTLTHSLEKADQERARLQAELTAESTRRAAAEEKSRLVTRFESELEAKDRRLAALQDEIVSLKEAQVGLKTTLARERKAAEDKLAVIKQAEQEFLGAFRALSAEALKSNNQSFLELARTTLEDFQQGARSDLSARQKAIDGLVKPLLESLERVDSRISEFEKDRTVAYTTLADQVTSLARTQAELEGEAASLLKVLRSPQVRGRWGEIQLQRVVEMAGMVEHCDFVRPDGAADDNGRRPDLIVNLPNHKRVVVDAQAALDSYLASLEMPDGEERLEKLRDYARSIRAHVERLGQKETWEQFDPAPEFVVVFLPGEVFFMAALQQDPALIEFGVDRRVILATPTTLIALLKAVASGWRQARLAENAQIISDLGRQLYERVRALAELFARVGGRLDETVGAYNQAVACLEGRVLFTARRFKELGPGADGEIEPLAAVEKTPRPFQAAELAALSGAGAGDASPLPEAGESGPAYLSS